jgi:hypothetical protein
MQFNYHAATSIAFKLLPKIYLIGLIPALILFVPYSALKPTTLATWFSFYGTEKLFAAFSAYQGFFIFPYAFYNTIISISDQIDWYQAVVCEDSASLQLAIEFEAIQSNAVLAGAIYAAFLLSTLRRRLTSVQAWKDSTGSWQVFLLAVAIATIVIVINDSSVRSIGFSTANCS